MPQDGQAGTQHQQQRADQKRHHSDQSRVNYGGHHALLHNTRDGESAGAGRDSWRGNDPPRAPNSSSQAAAEPGMADAGRNAEARNEYAIRERQSPDERPGLHRCESTYGVKVRPSNSTAGG